jgi:hypothetical protein
VHACPRTLLRSAVISEEARRKFFEKQGAWWRRLPSGGEQEPASPSARNRNRTSH